jgi:hypothetical protein
VTPAPGLPSSTDLTGGPSGVSSFSFVQLNKTVTENNRIKYFFMRWLLFNISCKSRASNYFQQ